MVIGKSRDKIIKQTKKGFIIEGTTSMFLQIARKKNAIRKHFWIEETLIRKL